MSALFLPALCAAVLTAGLFARIDVYGAFVRGAKAGMETLLQMAPCLCAVLTLTALLREGGLLGALTEALRPLCCVISGASETVFFTASLYLGAAGVKRSRYAVPAALVAYAAGVWAAAWLV